MSNHVPPSVHQVWEWRAKAAEETRDMTTAEVIAYYRARGQEALKQLQLDLPIVAPTGMHRPGQH